MKTLVIGISFYQRDLIQNLKDRGLYVIGVDGDPNPYCKDMVDKFLHIDVKDYKEIAHKIRSEDVRIFNVASDITLPTTSKLNSELNLKGMKYETYERFQSKSEYFKLFDELGVSIPKTYGVEDLSYIPKGKYIVKPSQGAGNRGVKIITDIHNFDFDSHKENYYRDGEDHVIQEYIEGQKHTLDGMCFHKSFYPLAFSNSYNVEGGSLSDEIHFSSTIQNDYQSDIIKSCESICNEIHDGMVTPIHMEFISTTDGIYLIDFSLRGGGYDIFTRLIPKITGYDILDNYINGILGEPVEIPFDVNTRFAIMNLIYSEKNGILHWENKLVEDSEDVFVKYLAEDNSEVKIPERDGDRIAYTISYGDTLEEAKKLSDKIEQKIQYTIK